MLLTLDNLANRGQYLNASNTFRELFAYGTVPVVNENDTVAVEELRIGDNDTLSAQARHGSGLRLYLNPNRLRSCASATMTRCPPRRVMTGLD